MRGYTGDEEKRALRDARILSWAGKIEGRVQSLELNLGCMVETRLRSLRRRIEKLEELHYKNQPYPEDHNYPELTHHKPKPHTCGECRHPWRKVAWAGVEKNLACFKHQTSVEWRDFYAPACDDFVLRGESCTE
jgi:hypothetical protein